MSLVDDLKNASKSNFIDEVQLELSDSKWYWFFLSIVLAQAWVLYLTFYNSRVIGVILTAVINKFVKIGHIRLGKQSLE